MGVAVLRDSLDSFVAISLPEAPSAPQKASPDSMESVLAEFNHAKRAYVQQVATWKSRMSTSWSDLQEVVESWASEGDPVVTKFIVDEFLPQALQAVEELIVKIRSGFDLDPDRQERVARLDATSPRLAKVFRKAQRQFRELLSEQYDFAVDLYYQALALQADCNPDARDGPQFSSPEDLGAYLRQQTQA